MSSEENKEIALSLLEALNARDLSVWSKHLAEDYIAQHPGVSIPLDKSRSLGYQRASKMQGRADPEGDESGKPQRFL